MEGGHSASKEEFSTCWTLLVRNPYILQLAFSAGVGGLLFGYDTGVISGAALYIKNDFSQVAKSTVLLESIVSVTIAAAIIGAAVGGYVNDKYGRKRAIIGADIVFAIGAVIMAVSPNPWVLILGRVFVGLGVGIASVSVPLYISESSPAKIRGALVSTNGFMITGGQFLSYLINLAFTKVNGTWRWMLGVAGIPALMQLVLVVFLPESPRWLYRQKKVDQAVSILERLYPKEEVQNQVKALEEAVEMEAKDDKTQQKFLNLLKSPELRPAVVAGVGLAVLQQLVGINTVMYYSPTIVQLAGFSSNSLALQLSLITSGLNALGSVLGMYLIDRAGRRKLAIVSLSGVIVSLAMLTAVFNYSSKHSPPVARLADYGNQTALVCPKFTHPESPLAFPSVHCYQCVIKGCGYCVGESSTMGHNFGTCLVQNKTSQHLCNNLHHNDSTWYTSGCPNNLGWLAIIGMALYICFFAPGMGIVPWTVNSEIYPLKYRGIGGGLAATCLWIANLIVSETFLTLTKTIGTDMAFLVFMCVACVTLVFVIFYVPETKGMSLERLEQMLHDMYVDKQQGKSSFFDIVNKKYEYSSDDEKDNNKGESQA